MEVSYIMAGKRFKARDHNDLNRQLNQLGLVTNLDNKGLGSLSARRTTEPGTVRYNLVQSYGDSADIEGYDVCVGKVIMENRDSEVIEVTELSELEKTLEEVKQDIPDAKVLVGSYWI